MLILGVDCAHKSFALCVVDYNEKWKEEHFSICGNNKNIKDTLIKLNNLYDTAFKIIYLKVFDLIPDIKLNKSTLPQRTLGLKKLLKKVDKKFPNLDLVLIEYQMSSNFKSREIFSNTFYHFIDKCPTFRVGPSLKNTIAFNKELRHSIFVTKYSDYTANKNHSKENLKYWLKLFKLEKFLLKIKKKNIDDAADSFLTIFSFIINNSGPYSKNR